MKTANLITPTDIIKFGNLCRCMDMCYSVTLEQLDGFG